MKPLTSFSVVFSFAWVTFREIVRANVLYNVFVCTFLLFGLTLFASKLTAVEPDRVIIDYGLSTVILSSVIVTLFIGSSLIPNELENRTAHLVFSRPIRISDFIVGKFLGLLFVILVNGVLLSMALAFFLYLVSSDESRFTLTLGYGLLLAFFQCSVLGSVAIMFSIFSTSALAASLSVGIYFIGQNISLLRLLADRLENPFLRWPVFLVGQTFPNFEYFHLGTKITYGLPVSFEFVLYSILYAFLLIVFFLFLSSVLMSLKEI